MRPIRIGIMGLGGLGRQLLALVHQRPVLDIVAIADVADPAILAHLVSRTPGTQDLRLVGNYLQGGATRARLLQADRPAELPWDVFDVDVVIEATGRFRSAAELETHLSGGAPRVVLATLPADEVDRVVLHGVNDDAIRSEDRIVSAGSASTTAAALALSMLAERCTLEHASMTSVHAYTSDQSLADRAGPDYRRSRSGAENIIPNTTPALFWLEHVLPGLAGRMTGYALNVPVQFGSMLDLTVVLAQPVRSVEEIRDWLREGAASRAGCVETTDDPIVSSDVRGRSCSLLVDLEATMLVEGRVVKIIGWHETLGHAARILDVVADYARLEGAAERESA